MASLPLKPRGVAPARRAAPKRDRRQWRRMARLSPPETLLAAIPSLPRPMLERMADRIIERLDQMDGDWDHEHDDDDWGVDDDPRGMDPDEGVLFPEYGPDQSRPPVNLVIVE